MNTAHLAYYIGGDRRLVLYEYCTSGKLHCYIGGDQRLAVVIKSYSHF